MDIAIEIDHLSKTYAKRNSGSVKAVDALSLSIQTGQVLGFLGPNGAGKTTTIKMICGLVQSSTGQVLLNGHNVVRSRRHAMRQIGVVLEGARNIYWRLSSWQNLMYFGRLKGSHGKSLKQRAEQLLTELDLWERRNDPVGTFSRGMQQKVAIASALIADPPIVLLDEPTLGLDVQASRTVKWWVNRLAREQGKTVVLTTHQLDMAEELCDRIAIMRQGKLIADQPVSELLDIFQQEFYQIRMRGHLNGHRPPWLNGMQVLEANGETVLSGALQGQEALYDVIGHVRGLGLPLVSVVRTEPDLEEIFVRLVEEH
ncbi:MAG: sodium transport system ATP-binding protein [Chloroflexi bacterium AL-W]|nr:sodium transport system ATP-binding protein [Chloroflexi bacterium AL-N1]NOK66040.1 sodium transport system ATP-binding protein [Chloroflexi bacterium AL-N10]NOK72921.1 sodium transport system ATP-binding protein [Chloroflexi bacterium AL-N5]NOK79818.1 sodium transport system ATP-binding protein [Chloroflexi bacterium AL-W]NOK88326.1 sodium transport system ATP-binding protein [Chloroflexi bacterium AL-N15]